MKFYVVRHPWTEYNINKISQGWEDSPLTPQGIVMAEKLSSFFKDKPIFKILTSDLGRCVQTSQIINNDLNVEVVKIFDLREQNLGKFNGVKKDIIRKEFDENDYSAIPVNGESFLQMKERVLNYIKNELPRYYDDVLIVTHTGCFQSILSDSLSVDLDSEKCLTTPLTIGLFELEDNNIKFIERYDLK